MGIVQASDRTALLESLPRFTHEMPKSMQADLYRACGELAAALVASCHKTQAPAPVAADSAHATRQAAAGALRTPFSGEVAVSWPWQMCNAIGGRAERTSDASRALHGQGQPPAMFRAAPPPSKPRITTFFVRAAPDPGSAGCGQPQPSGAALEQLARDANMRRGHFLGSRAHAGNKENAACVDKVQGSSRHVGSSSEPQVSSACGPRLPHQLQERVTGVPTWQTIPGTR
jgi:hypothetical protein